MMFRDVLWSWTNMWHFTPTSVKMWTLCSFFSSGIQKMFQTPIYIFFLLFKSKCSVNDSQSTSHCATVHIYKWHSWTPTTPPPLPWDFIMSSAERDKERSDTEEKPELSGRERPIVLHTALDHWVMWEWASLLGPTETHTHGNYAYTHESGRPSHLDYQGFGQHTSHIHTYIYMYVQYIHVYTSLSFFQKQSSKHGASSSGTYM